MGPPIIALMLTAQAATATAPPTSPEKPRLICRAAQQETGSHIRTGRRCKTEAEWAREKSDRTVMPPSARITEGQNDGLANPRPQ
jgi:hypothetical protein